MQAEFRSEREHLHTWCIKDDAEGWENDQIDEEKEKQRERGMCVDGIRSSKVGQLDRLESLMWPTL